MLSQWTFVTCDRHGGKIVEGLLTLPDPLQRAGRFYGSWQAQYVGPSGEDEAFGPQARGGKLMGQFNDDGQLVLQLNPSMNDSNVNLVGEVEGESRFVGRWVYANFRGTVNDGTFEAHKQP